MYTISIFKNRYRSTILNLQRSISSYDKVMDIEFKMESAGNPTEFRMKSAGNTTEFKRESGGNTTEFKRKSAGNPTEFKMKSAGNPTEFLMESDGNPTEFKMESDGNPTELKGAENIAGLNIVLRYRITIQNSISLYDIVTRYYLRYR